MLIGKGIQMIKFIYSIIFFVGLMTVDVFALERDTQNNNAQNSSLSRQQTESMISAPSSRKDNRTGTTAQPKTPVQPCDNKAIFQISRQALGKIHPGAQRTLRTLSTGS